MFAPVQPVYLMKAIAKIAEIAKDCQN